ncbi:ethanolamine-phosphate cytidylyltransferase ASCRUDRAFT_76706 [Ascoidea rubescens DSM 1968]|uniref:ethanolamine-phosphate cytidylyltransferase n=1 Tax=Ascoidea rubescens DSM 1968 TaxID=1344418 RepID=A0A1D2VF18_9ASCO|nr:hypothetical protein ASCRUDRAFT_76706 [Ascoidea rubescens DSM 1968]ODV60215.1 hypothetical protein ASCRUDRAFT_76706 [Ascoidea rubescens DSM 1968]
MTKDKQQHFSNTNTDNTDNTDNQVTLYDSRIWVDGCFDFTHHGHAGAMLQAKRLGTELYVGIHSDEDILLNKGPTVMSLDERITAVNCCKWCNQIVPYAPYVTDPKVLDEYHCKYVVHGDDITTDANGKDCYQVCKDLGRFLVVKRTPNISTTDLVGRMLLFSKSHFISTLTSNDLISFHNNNNKKNITNSITNQLLTQESYLKFKDYATCENGLDPGSLVYIYTNDNKKINDFIDPSLEIQSKINNNGIYYIDGGFDLFQSGQIEALKIVYNQASSLNIPVIVGINDDTSINKNKGLNYPIMNLFERSLCVLQCKYINGIILGAPYIPNSAFINLLSQKINNKVWKVFHGPTSEFALSNNESSENLDKKVLLSNDPYYDCKKMGIYQNIGSHKYDNVSTEAIVKRVLDNRLAYEERQRKKGWKSEIERKLESDEKNKLNQASKY